MIKLPSRYTKIISPLKGGGMSETLLCEDAHLQRNVVVKGLSQHIEKNRLLDELAALSAIRSKYVVQVFDCIYDNDEIVGLVEEYVEGASLSPITKPIKLLDALQTLYPIFAGVAEVHAHKLLHRDLKPDNMKFDGAGNLKLFDFGLAKLAAAATTQQLYFTAGYAAPEIFQKDSAGNHVFTPAVDVFAAGVTALWLLNSGQLPPELSNIPPTLPCADFGHIGIAFPPDIRALLNRTLAYNPADRPTAEDVRVALARQLLFDQHRMLITHDDVAYSLNSGQRVVTLSIGENSVTLQYDGYDFVVIGVKGHARRNNTPISVGDKFVGASVIVFDGLNGYPKSITADISHPEVTL